MAKSESSELVHVDPLTGEIVIKVAADAANRDWIRAARLEAAAEAGDLEAARQLKDLQETPAVREFPD